MAVLVALGVPSSVAAEDSVMEFSQQPESLVVRIGEPIQLTAAILDDTATMHWLRGDVLLPASEGGGLLIREASFADAGVYQAVATGTHGEAISRRVRVEVLPITDPGTLQFDPGWELRTERFGGGFDAVAALADGGVVVAGNFLSINQHPTRTVAKFRADGTIDELFICEVDLEDDSEFISDLPGDVNALLELPDGRLLLGGHVRISTALGPRWGLLRLNADGSIDETFDATELGEPRVFAMDMDASGRVYVAAGVAGPQPTSEVMRLTTSGGLDDSFRHPFEVIDAVDHIAVAPNGEVFVATSRGRERRLFHLDTSGDILGERDVSDFRFIYSLNLDAGGRLYVHGYMEQPSTTGWRRFTAAGDLDTGFSGSGGHPSPHDAVIIPDGGMLISSSAKLERVSSDGQSVTTIWEDSLGDRSRLLLDAVGRPVLMASDWNPDIRRPSLYRFDVNLESREVLTSSVWRRGVIRAIIPQTEGRFLLLGDFGRINGQSRRYAALVTQDGGFGPHTMNTAFDGPVLDAALNAAGQIYVLGEFTESYGTAVNGLVRLSADGSLDTTFNANQSAASIIRFDPGRKIEVLADGSLILAAGVHLTGDTYPEYTINRLTSSGVLDLDFRSRVLEWHSFDLPHRMVELLDGRIISMPSYAIPHSLIWLNADGTRAPEQVDTKSVYTANANIVTDMQDRVWHFSTLHVDRYDSDGEVDPTFTAPAEVVNYTFDSPRISRLERQENDGMLVFGDMSFRDPVPGSERRDFAVRLNPDGSVDEGFAIKGLSARVDAALSLEDGNFILATNGTLRRTTEVRPPTVAVRTQSEIVAEGSMLQLVADIAGHADGFQWFRNGVRLTGRNTPVLTIPSLDSGDTGEYSVVVRNESGVGVSQVFIVRVLASDGGAVGVHAAGQPFGTFGGIASFTVNNRVDFTGTPSQITWSALLPEGWAVEPAAGSGAAVIPASGSMELAEWMWTALGASPLEFTYDLIPPADAPGRSEIAALLTVRHEGESVETTVNPDPLIIRLMSSATHAADTDGDSRLGLSELLRVIELYNTRSGTSRTGRYRMNVRSVDGFDVDLEGGAFGEISLFHSADTDNDAAISLGELLRVIELYNTRSGAQRTGGYRSDDGSVDGFTPNSD